MRNFKLVIALFSVFISFNFLYSQESFNFSDKKTVNIFKKNSLNVFPTISKENLVINLISELYQLKENFLYYSELNSGDLKVEFDEKQIKIIFFNTTSRVSNILKIDITDNEKASDQIYESNLKDFIRQTYIDSLENLRSIGPIQNITNWHFSNNIFIDRNILDNYGKIVNKGLANAYLRDANNNPAHIFSHATDGIIVPYFTGSNWEALTVAVDKGWSRFVEFTNIGSERPIAGFGNLGSGEWQFSMPTGIDYLPYYLTYGGSCTYYNYPFYIADKNLGRIDKFIYTMEHCTYPFNLYGVQVPSQWSIFKNDLNSPYDIATHQGIDINSQTDDIIWVSESPGIGTGPGSITCINSAGQIYGKINKINFGNGNEDIYPTRLSVFRSPNGSKNVLAFIDENKNALVFCKLNSNGKFYTSGNPIISIVGFGYQKLNSVMLNSQNNGLGETMVLAVSDGGAGGCEGGQNCGYLSTLKINYIANQPVSVDYLSTCWAGKGSDKSFVNLENLYANNGFNEIFTIEKWSDNYGLRRYRNGVDIISEDFTNTAKKYCTETGYNFSVKLTNPAKVFFQCWYDCGAGSCTWTPTSINYINGVYTNSSSYYLNAGNNYINMKINIPAHDNMTGNERFKIKMTVVPIDESDLNSSNGVSRQIERFITDCSSGGCPFVYVYDGTDFRQDNNILHRSGFENNIGVDIEDKYILQVNPNVNLSDSTISLKIAELNQDHSYFDRFKLIAIDHPIGTKLGITEYGQYILYSPSLVSSPFIATYNGLDVTDILQFDTVGVEVEGDSDDEVDGGIATLGGRKNNNSRNLKDLIHETFKKHIDIYKDILNIREQIVDSVAVIIDPNQPDIIGGAIIKAADAGTVIVYNQDANFESVPIPFARRQNNSMVVVPVSDDIQIDSVHIDWNNDFALSYLASTVVYYGGYLEKELQFIEAYKSHHGTVLDELLNINGKYADLLPDDQIELKFKIDTLQAPEGFQRSYVLVTNGRYQTIEGLEGRPANTLENIANIPKEFALNQNYPNPFNPVTTIKYDIPEEGNLTLSIYDINGRELFKINEFKRAGSYSIVFNGSNFASGIYFYRLSLNGKKSYSKTLKMLLVK